MRLHKLKLNNFRAYATEVEIVIDDLTVILGKNDAGKSSILDALDIFFNEPKGLPEAGDFNVSKNCDTLSITCVFDDLPDSIVIDEVAPTSLAGEYMVNADGHLEIKKVYPKTGKSKVFAVANHPQNAACNNLLTLTNAQLKTAARSLGIDEADQRINTQLRRAIWASSDNLNLGRTEIELAKESAKAVWGKLKPEIPVYTLFKSDRPSTDQDAEAQDPMKMAIKEAIATQETELEAIRKTVEEKIQGIADKTIEKIKEMSPELASELNPQVVTKKWETLFNVSLTGDGDIPINKRGSGTRRLVLLNFFRAKAEQDSTSKGTGIIYAIEEPETSQHPNNQRMLIDAFEDLVTDGTCQVLLTTHTPVLARRFNRDRLRIVTSESGCVSVQCGSNDSVLKEITRTLGILPDHDVKLFLGLEGKNDISFLRTISKILCDAGEDILDLGKEEDEGRLVFIPGGGSSVELWVTRLNNLNIPEYHIFDRDNPLDEDPHYKEVADQINDLPNAEALHTSKSEMENYIHHSVIVAECSGYPGQGEAFEDVPYLFAKATHEANDSDAPWDDLNDEKQKSKVSRAKRRLNTTIVEKMTAELLTEVDSDGDIRRWLGAIGNKLQG